MISVALIALVILYVSSLLRFGRLFNGGYSHDLGFVFLTLLFLYTAIPGLAFIFLDYELMPGFPWQELAKLEPTYAELAEHLWRHNLFFAATAGTYLYSIRVEKSARHHFNLRSIKVTNRETVILFVIFLALATIKIIVRGDIGDYSEKYLAGEDSGALLGALTSVNNRLLVGLEYLIVVCAFLCAGRLYVARAIMVLTMIVFEVLVSSGSRIEVLFLLLSAYCLLNLTVYRVPLAATALVGLMGTLLAGFVEVYRYENFNIETTLDHFYRFGLSPPGEFGAVFLTGFHLYLLADAGAVPSTDIRMFFFDIVSLFQPNSFQEFSPQYWYWKMFYPTSMVPPQTNGPISDSAIWGGGLVDLIIRGCMIGAVFALVANRIYSGRAGLAWVVVYVFYFSTAVMTLKYSVLWQLNPLVKTILPILLLYYFSTRRLRRS